MICEGFNFTKRATGMFESCVRTGSYGLRECAESVSNIIDIGANVGFFSVTARILCPDAQIVSMEPDAKVWPQLLQNAKHMRIQPINVGIGDGKPLKQYQKTPKDRGCYGTRFDSDGNGEDEIQSFSLPQIVERFGLQQGLFIKIDCEGGERNLFGHPESEEIIRNCAGIGGEIHPIAGGPTRKEYEVWLKNLIGDTHKIKFFRAAGSGIGEFRAVRISRKAAETLIKGSEQIRFIEQVKQGRRRSKNRIIWKQGEIYELPSDKASHFVCCEQAEYVL